MKNEKLTKKEIAKKIKAVKRNGFNNGYDYSGIVRGFNFITLDKKDGEIYEEDDTGFCSFVAICKNKKEVVNEIYDWVKIYAPQNFDS